MQKTVWILLNFSCQPIETKQQDGVRARLSWLITADPDPAVPLKSVRTLKVWPCYAPYLTSRRVYWSFFMIHSSSVRSSVPRVRGWAEWSVLTMMLPRTERSCYHSGRTHLSLIKHTQEKPRSKDTGKACRDVGQGCSTFQQHKRFSSLAPDAFSIPMHSSSREVFAADGKNFFLPRHMNGAGGESLAENWQFVLTDSLDTM